MSLEVATPAPRRPSPDTPDSPATQGRFDRPFGSFLRRLHFYVGLFVGPFLLVAALSGFLYALAPQLEQIAYRDVLTVEYVTDPLPIEDQVAAAEETQPDKHVVQVWPAASPTDSTRVLFDQGEDAPRLSVFVDPNDARVLGSYETTTGLGELPLRTWIASLHSDLHLGEPGRIYSELAASWMWILALGGIWMWWRHAAAKRGQHGTAAAMLRGVPVHKGRRVRTLSWHGVIGTWVLVFMLALSATGITWSHYAGGHVKDIVNAMQWENRPLNTTLGGAPEDAAGSGHEGHAGHAGHTGHGEEAANPAADAASQVDVAKQADVVAATSADALRPATILTVPANPGEAWTVSERWIPWRFTSDTLTVDPNNGEIVDSLPFKDRALFSKLTDWGIYLHMGIMFGLPLQLLLASVGLAIATMVILGYRMWWQRRPRVGGLPTVPRLPAYPSPGVLGACAVVALTIGVFLPLMGITFVVFCVLDLALIARRRRKLRQR